MDRIIGRIIKKGRTGWGFISSKDIEFTRIFFHWTELTQSTLNFLDLRVGMYVKFTPMHVPGRGYRALNIEVIERPSNEPESEVPELSELGLEDVGEDHPD